MDNKIVIQIYKIFKISNNEEINSLKIIDSLMFIT